MSTRPDLAGVIDGEWLRPEHACDGTDEACAQMCPVPAYSRMGLDELRDVAAAALNTAIDAWLADEGTRERMWEAVAAVRDASPRTTDDADSWDVLDAALAALTTPTTTEPEEGKR